MWLGTAILINHVLAMAMSFALQRDYPDNFPAGITDGCFVESVAFTCAVTVRGRRYLA